MARTQAKRKIAISTPLGDDALLLTGVRVREQLGRLTEIDAVMLSEDPELDFGSVVGKNVTIRMDLDDSTERYWNGFVSQFSQQGASGHLPLYRATVVPWLWFLTRNADYRIFQQMTVPDIIKQVFRDRGFTDFSESLSGSYSPWEYCVQYRETDFNFISRLMEQEGIYYFFKHEDGKHGLVLADAPVAHSPYPGYDTIKYRAKIGGPKKEQEYVFSWALDQVVQPDAYETIDYDFKLPRKALKSNAKGAESHAPGPLEVFDFPGEYVERSDGDQVAKTRIEELQAQFETVRGESNCRGLACGSLFTLEDHPRGDQNREYLVTAAAYEMVADDHSTGNGSADDGAGRACSCHFTAIDSRTPFRAPRNTPKPHIQGPQTAVVVGPGGEEIYTDEHGRIKVHFHWDRHNKPDDKASCWIRVSQPWAGKAWGGVTIPRIGQEVIVEFLEGDPDQPIVTGRVYNGDQTPPYALPANKTQSGLKSRSSPGGGAANFNEIRMEDKKGEEQLYLHAEKNQDIVVENDETHSVGHDRKKQVDNDERVGIGNNRTESVGKNENISIGSSRTENVGENEKISIGSNRNTDVGKNEDVSVGENRTESVGKDESVTIGGSRSDKVGKDDKLEVTDNRTEENGKDYKVQVGKKFALVAGDEVLIQTGDASILMKKNGDIQIKGKSITVVGSDKIGIKASSDLTLKGSKIAEN